MVDTSDSLPEVTRKLETTRREVLERQEHEPESFDEDRPPYVVLTKIDKVTSAQQEAVSDLVTQLGFPSPVALSSLTGTGVEELQNFIRERLFGAPFLLQIHHPSSSHPDASERIVSSIYDQGMVEEDKREKNGTITVKVWMTEACLAQLCGRWGSRIDIK